MLHSVQKCAKFLGHPVYLNCVYSCRRKAGPKRRAAELRAELAGVHEEADSAAAGHQRDCEREHHPTERHLVEIAAAATAQQSRHRQSEHTD